MHTNSLDSTKSQNIYVGERFYCISKEGVWKWLYLTGDINIAQNGIFRSGTRSHLHFEHLF